jgi:hypothetical protein
MSFICSFVATKIILRRFDDTFQANLQNERVTLEFQKKTKQNPKISAEKWTRIKDNWAS